MKDFVHVYVVFRVDFFHMKDSCVLKKENADMIIRTRGVYPSIVEAESEVERLNDLSDGDDCVYYWDSAKASPDMINTSRG